MPFDFAKPGRVLHGYPADADLGFQHIKPVALDELDRELDGYNIAWQYEKFVEPNKDLIPSASGVYFFIVHPHAANIEYHSIILYFGEAANLRARYKQYLDERDGVRDTDREHIKMMLNIYRNRIFFAYCRLDRYDVTKVQDILIDAFSPCCNRQHAKKMPAFEKGYN